MSLILLPAYRNSLSIPAGTGRSVLFNGTSDYDEFPYRSEYAFSTGDWTFEAFVSFNSIAPKRQTLFGFNNGGGVQSPYLMVVFNGSALSLEEATAFAGTGTNSSVSWTPTIGQWYHIAFVRNNNIITYYVDGLPLTSYTYSGAQLDAMNLVVGALHYGSQGYKDKLDGFLSNVRITKSAVYTSSFARPTSVLPALPNTVFLACRSDNIEDLSSISAYPIVSGGTISQLSPFDVTTSSNNAGFDSLFDYNAMLLHMEGLEGATTFSDTCKNVATSYGAVTTGVDFKFGTSCASFAGGYVQWPSFTFRPTSTTPWTVELWVKPLTSAPGGFIIGAADPIVNSVFWSIGLAAGNVVQLYSYNGSASIVVGSIGLSPSEWTHIAISCFDTNASIFIDGVLDTTGTFNTPTTTASTPLILGQAINAKFQGKVDELRITQGINRYTTSFVAPTAAFPDSFAAATVDPYGDALTLLLNSESIGLDLLGKTTFQTNTVGSSSNSRFGGKAMVFDGTAAKQLISTISRAGVLTTNWTIEGWAYVTPGSTGNRTIMSSKSNASDGLSSTFAVKINNNTNFLQLYTNIGRSISTVAVPLGRWFHFAFSSIASTVSTYIDGVSVAAPVAYATVYTGVGFALGSHRDGSGEPFNGMIDEVRITQGIGRYPAAFTPVKQTLAQPSVQSNTTFDPYSAFLDAQFRFDGTNGSTIITEDTGRPVNVFGTPTLSTDTAKFGGSSLKLNGTTDYLTLTSDAAFPFGTGDFTFEAWVYPTASNAITTIWGQSRNSGSSGLGVYINASDQIVISSVNIKFGTATLQTVPLNVWSHVMITRGLGAFWVYINGTFAGTFANTTNFTDTNFTIGASAVGTSKFTGYIDNLRVTKGAARVVGAAGFKLSTTTFPSLTTSEYSVRYSDDPYLAATVFQMGFDGLTPTDTTRNSAPTATAVTAVSYAFIDSGSGSFNGTTSAIDAPAKPAYALGSSDFTFETWIYPTAHTSCLLLSTMTAANLNGGFFIQMDVSGQLCVGNADFTFISYQVPVVPLGRWSHVAVTRKDNVLTLWLNGVAIGVNDSFTLNLTDSVVRAGITYTGLMDNIRLTKSVRYTAAFVPMRY